MRADDGSNTLVIVPTCNEALTLTNVIRRVFAVLPAAHVLVIDDASTDGTGELADELSRSDRRVSTLHRPAKLGLGTAYVAGFKHALTNKFRWVIELDADGSHQPEQLPDLLLATRTGVGLVIGARWVEGGRVVGWPWYRRWISRTGTRVARFSLRSQLHDLTSGFRVIDTEWLAKLDLEALEAQGYGFQVEVAWRLERAGCPIAEVPITFVERQSGRSKMTLGIVFEALLLVLRWGWLLRFNSQSAR